MITLHRLGHTTEPLHINHDLILSVEANPDTVLRLTSGEKIVVAESPEEVIAMVRECRIQILSGALMRRDTEAAVANRAARVAPRRALTAVDPPTLSPVDENRDCG
jgi:flagellar protein FlbD